jgi:DNA-binding response OmpR family regulator
MGVALPAHLIIVDDDRFSAQYMHRVLTQHHLDVVTAPTAGQAQSLLRQRPADLVLLDVTLPDASGFDVCRWLRQDYADVGIIFVSGHVAMRDRLQAFDLGADDFLAKPFMNAELVARVQAVLRRRGAPVTPIVRVGAVMLDLALRQLSLPGGQTIALSDNETRMMAALLAQPGQLVLRVDLARAIYGAEQGTTLTAQRALEAELERLVALIEPEPRWARYIQIVRHVGARFIGSRT